MRELVIGGPGTIGTIQLAMALNVELNVERWALELGSRLFQDHW